jgi:hypothetical protein
MKPTGSCRCWCQYTRLYGVKYRSYSSWWEPAISYSVYLMYLNNNQLCEPTACVIMYVQASVASWHCDGTIRVVCQTDCCPECSEALERQHAEWCSKLTAVPSWLLSCVCQGSGTSTYKVPKQDFITILHWNWRVKESCLPSGGLAVVNISMSCSSTLFY